MYHSVCFVQRYLAQSILLQLSVDLLRDSATKHVISGNGGVSVGAAVSEVKHCKSIYRFVRVNYTAATKLITRRSVLEFISW